MIYDSYMTEQTCLKGSEQLLGHLWTLMGHNTQYDKCSRGLDLHKILYVLQEVPD